MVFHYIAIASDYVNGQRVAWHYPSAEKLDQNRIKSFMQKALKHKSTHFGIHKLSTNSLNWESVVEKDSFFADVMATKNEDQLFRILCEDKNILAIDVATFILAMSAMSHLKLQKLLYLSYADYLEKYEKPLFTDKIVAYRYGPVVEEVYQIFKKYGAEKITDKEKYSFFVKDTAIPPLLMKIAKSDEGEKAIASIIETIKKYNDLTANELVSLTHSKNSPWSKTYKLDYENRVIVDETMLKYHVNESK